MTLTFAGDEGQYDPFLLLVWAGHSAPVFPPRVAGDATQPVLPPRGHSAESQVWTGRVELPWWFLQHRLQLSTGNAWQRCIRPWHILYHVWLNKYIIILRFSGESKLYLLKSVYIHVFHNREIWFWKFFSKIYSTCTRKKWMSNLLKK